MLRLNRYRCFFLLIGPELVMMLNKLSLEADLWVNLLLTSMGLPLPFQKDVCPIRTPTCSAEANFCFLQLIFYFPMALHVVQKPE